MKVYVVTVDYTVWEYSTDSTTTVTSVDGVFLSKKAAKKRASELNCSEPGDFSRGYCEEFEVDE